MKGTGLKNIILVLALCIPMHGASAYNHPDNLEERLLALDKALEESGRNEESKRLRIAQLEEKYAKAGTSSEQRYYLGKSLIEENISHDFDKAMFYLRRNLETAESLGDADKTDESLIRIAWFYASSGYYYEADQILNNRLSGFSASSPNWLLYCLAQQNLYNEILNHSEMPYSESGTVAKAESYTAILLEQLPHDSSDWVRLKVIDLLAKHRPAEAREVCEAALNLFCTQPRLHALAAYLYAILCGASGDTDEMIGWYAVSACEYAGLCVKDNNSLYLLSTLLYDRGDVDRARRYAEVALRNSSEYDRNLRYGQVAGYLNRLEDMERDAERERLNHFRTILAVVVTFTLCLIAALSFLVIMNRRLHRAKKTLKERNLHISSLNRELCSQRAEIVEANRVKEEYIAMFLSISSQYIDKLTSFQNDVRRRISRNQTDELLVELRDAERAGRELDNFYRMFDDIFLNIYPTFVDDFNSLLSDEGKISLPKGGGLNAELRIYALVRLGINDSTRIASLLHYSVQTIYNYRNKVKNAALDRAGFEDAVRGIGSFSV